MQSHHTRNRAMYFSYDELINSISVNDPKIKNYLDTFGFVVVRGVLNSSEYKTMLREYDAQYSKRKPLTSVSDRLKLLLTKANYEGRWLPGLWYLLKALGFRKLIKTITDIPGQAFLPNFVDSSELYTNFYLGDKFDKIYKYFCGESYLYLGSDGSKFMETSFPWHRDWFTNMPILKFNFYYNPLPFFGGRFCIIPGSNRPDDQYTRLIQKSMSWPLPCKNAGGMHENNFLPETENPRDIFSRKKHRVKVPHVKISVGRGDVVIFDQRCVHCVENSFPKFPRRLMTILLGKNAFDLPDNHVALEKHSRDALMGELVDLVVSERNHIGINSYGEALLNSDFTKTHHFIKMEKSDLDGRWSKGTFKIKNGVEKSYHIDFAKYQAIGSAFGKEEHTNTASKNTAQGKYGDVHMGINVQNIKETNTQEFSDLKTTLAAAE